MKWLISGLVALVLSVGSASALNRAYLDDMRQATVEVQTKDGGHGSGVVISSFEVLSATHMGRVGDKVLVVFNDGTTRKGTFSKVLGDTDTSLIVLSVPEAVKPAEVACREPLIAEPITVIGSPMFLHWVVTLGIVASVHPDELLPETFTMLDVTGNPGNSGGPVFDDEGKVLGTVTASLSAYGERSDLLAMTKAAAFCKFL